MKVSPLASCERVKHVQDDQDRYLGRHPAMVRLSVSWPRLKLSALRLLLDECPGVDNPIDELAHLRESLHFGDGAPPPLRPECERGLVALVHAQSSPAPRRVCAWLWLPTRLSRPPMSCGQ